jgi:tetratricopeptide (TPR) repeat protein
MGASEDSPKSDRNPWYDRALTIAIIAGLLAIIPSLLPLVSEDIGDFIITVNPMPIEAKPTKHVFLARDIEDWPTIPLENESAKANVFVKDNNILRNYRHPVWLRAIEDRNLTIRFENPVKEPPFTAQMFVQVKDPTKSIEYAPVTIQGIGGDGRIRNCTVYIVYKSPEDLVNEGAIQFELGRYDEAIKLFDKAIDINSSYSPAWKAESYAYLTLEDYENGLEYINRYLDVNKTDPEALILKGWALDEIGDYPGRYNEAIEVLDKAIDLDPQNAWAWSNKGNALTDLGRYPEAIQAFNKAIELEPLYALAYSNKGWSLDEQGKYDEAIEALDRAIELDPQLALAWCNKGNTLTNQGKYDEAIEALDQAIGLDSQLALAWNNKGVALTNQGKYDEAIKVLDKAIDLDPQLALAWNNKGWALNRKGKYNKAIIVLDKAIDLDPQLASAWNNKGVALNGNGKYDKAIQAFDNATEIDPELAAAWFGKSIALKGLGRTAESEEALARARDLGYEG